MNVLGIDLGTNKAAIIIITGEKESPAYSSHLFEADKKATTEKRMVSILEEIFNMVERIKPELIVCEYPFNIKGNARILVEMFGVVHYYCLTHGYPFMEVPQTTIKKYATGSGKAEKSDMRMQLYKEFGLDYPEDQTDAFWIGHMGMTYLYGSAKKHRQESIDRMKGKKK